MMVAAKNLTPDEKAVIEGLLGRRVGDSDSVSIQALPAVSQSQEERQQQTARLKRYFAEVDSRREPVSDSEADEILTEAIQSVRPGYCPRQ